MRYYAIEDTEGPERPQVVAEVTALPEESGCLRSSAIGTDLHGDYLTREELLAIPWGRRALMDWQAGDDSQFDAAMARTMREADERDARIAALSFDEWAAEVRADGLRLGFPPDETEQAIERRRQGEQGALRLV